MAQPRKKIPVRTRPRDDEEEDDDLVGPRTGGTRPAARPRRASGTSSRAPARGRSPRSLWEHDWVRSLVRDIPSFGKLLWGLARDPRVSKTDKALVAGVLVYAALPADVIPDWIPGLGEVEDLFLVALALSRLLSNAGEEVLEDHWDGDAETLDTLLEALDSASELLPGPIRGLLKGRR